MKERVEKWRKYGPNLISSFENKEISEISDKNKVFIESTESESKERMSKRKRKRDNKKVINTDVRMVNNESHGIIKGKTSGEDYERNMGNYDVVSKSNTVGKRILSWSYVCFGKLII